MLPSVSKLENLDKTLIKSHSDVVIAKARATMNLTAQLDDELSFSKGDIIEITNIQDRDFAVGIVNNIMGSFPLSFVEIIEGEIASLNSEAQIPESKFKWWEKEKNNYRNSTSSYSQSKETVDRKSENNINTATILTEKNTSVSYYENYSQTQLNNGHSNCSDVTAEQKEIKHPTHKRTSSYNQENTRSHDSAVTSYGRTIYPHVAEKSDQLSFIDNEIVKLFYHIGDQWLEGEIDGKIGLLPSDCVEIIVDCPWSEYVFDGSVEHTSSENTSRENESNYAMSPLNEFSSPIPFEKTTYGRVLYTLPKQFDNDLELTEGDTVIILKQADDYWYEVKHDDGRVGYCAVNCVEVIGENFISPISSTKLSDKFDFEPMKTEENLNKKVPLSTAVCEKMMDSNVTSSNVAVPKLVSESGDKKNVTDQREKPAIKQKPAVKPKPIRPDSSNFSPTIDRKRELPTNASPTTDIKKALPVNMSPAMMKKKELPVNVSLTIDRKKESPANPKLNNLTSIENKVNANVLTNSVEVSKVSRQEYDANKGNELKVNVPFVGKLESSTKSPPIPTRPSNFNRKKDDSAEQLQSMTTLNDLIKEQMASAKSQLGDRPKSISDDASISVDSLNKTSKFTKQISASSVPVKPIPMAQQMVLSPSKPKSDFLMQFQSQIGQSQFYSTEKTATLPARIAPPRPPINTPVSSSTKKVPPPRPAVPFKQSDNLIQFSPEKEKPTTASQGWTSYNYLHV